MINYTFDKSYANSKYLIDKSNTLLSEAKKIVNNESDADILGKVEGDI